MDGVRVRRREGGRVRERVGGKVGGRMRGRVSEKLGGLVRWRKRVRMSKMMAGLGGGRRGERATALMRVNSRVTGDEVGKFGFRVHTMMQLAVFTLKTSIWLWVFLIRNGRERAEERR